MALYIHTVLLILLGNIVAEAGLKSNSLIFWIIVVIVLGLFITHDILTSFRIEESDSEEEEKVNKGKK